MHQMPLLCELSSSELLSTACTSFQRRLLGIRKETDGMSKGLSIATLAWQLEMMWRISKQKITFYTQEDGMWWEIVIASPIALHSRSKHVPNDLNPMYGYSRPQCQAVHLKLKTDRSRRTGANGIRGQYATPRMVLMPGAESYPTGVSLTVLLEHVHSDKAIPPGGKFG